MQNEEIITFLTELAVYKELAGENTFKVRAIQNAARQLESFPASIAQLAEQKRLTELKGIGEAIEKNILEFLQSGTSSELSELKQKIPESLLELLKLQGLGPKKARVLWQELGVSNIQELALACQKNQVANLTGFGQKTQANLLKAIEFHQRSLDLFLYPEALTLAEEICQTLALSKLFSKIEIAGSLRRGKEIVKDADILLVPALNTSASQITEVVTALADRLKGELEISSVGQTKISLRYKGLQIDFRIIPEPSFACALQYFTGSKEHNTQLRGLAKQKGFKVNEYALTSVAETIYPKDEAEFYSRLGFAYIPPELREGEGELELAQNNQLPDFIRFEQIKGVLHVHTNYSDGSYSLEALVAECRKRGYQYVGISDHSQSAFYAGGLSEKQLLKQAEEIKALNEKYAPFKIFHGIEADILPDGSLDYSDEVLLKLDFVIGSIHSKLSMTKEEATIRFSKALQTGLITILGHPSGRLLLTREGYEYDREKLIASLLKNEVILEHNCHPARFDADWRMLKYSQEHGCLFAINPDLHTEDGFEHLKLGVKMAAKAWLKPASVINTWTAEELDGYFKRRKLKARSSHL